MKNTEDNNLNYTPIVDAKLMGFDESQVEEIDELEKLSDIEDDDKEAVEYDTESDIEAYRLSALSQYMNQFKYKELLTAQEEVELAKRIQDGDEEAFDELVGSNLRLVVHMAKKYRKEGIDFDDIIQEGNIGLMKAAKKFDYTKGYRFSTYAFWWIRQTVVRYLQENTGVLRVPVHAAEELYRYRVVVKKLSDDLNRTPTSKEIAEYMGKTIEEIDNYKMWTPCSVSLYQKMGEDNDTELLDLIPDTNKESIEDTASKTALSSQLTGIINNVLDQRSSYVIKCRFGLDGMPEKTLQELAEEMHLSRERIRQIESRAIRKLRMPKYKSLIKEFA